MTDLEQQEVDALKEMEALRQVRRKLMAEAARISELPYRSLDDELNEQ